MKKSYLLNIDADMWNKFKSACALKNKPMINILKELIEKFINSVNK